MVIREGFLEELGEFWKEKDGWCLGRKKVGGEYFGRRSVLVK